MPLLVFKGKKTRTILKKLLFYCEIKWVPFFDFEVRVQCAAVKISSFQNDMDDIYLWNVFEFRDKGRVRNFSFVKFFNLRYETYGMWLAFLFRASSPPFFFSFEETFGISNFQELMFDFTRPGRKSKAITLDVCLRVNSNLEMWDCSKYYRGSVAQCQKTCGKISVS